MDLYIKSVYFTCFTIFMFISEIRKLSEDMGTKSFQIKVLYIVYSIVIEYSYYIQTRGKKK